jgi:hypothetical protein
MRGGACDAVIFSVRTAPALTNKIKGVSVLCKGPVANPVYVLLRMRSRLFK